MIMTETETIEGAVKDDAVPELEGHFIIRFPIEIATEIRELILSESLKLHKQLQIELDEDRRHARVKFGDRILPAKLYDLPAIIESHKTFDRKMFYKIADISQIMICGEEQKTEENEKPYLFHEYIDKEGRDKRYLYPHGITPCLKNVRKNRFRKTRKNRCAETPFVQKEVLRLLKTDSEAIDYHFELVDPEDEKLKSASDKPSTSKDMGEGKTPGEFDIFGAILSSSDDSDEGNDERGTISASKLNSTEIEDQISVDNNYDSLFLKDKVEIKDNSDSDFPIEVEATDISPTELSRDEKIQTEKDKLQQVHQNLEREIGDIKAEKRSHEIELLEIKNPDLRMRYEKNIDYLTAKELEKQKECDDIVKMLD